MPYVRDMMRGKPAEVWTIEPRATVLKALELMADKNIGALPVVEDGKLVGMFSERDYARKVSLKSRSDRVVTVGELMSQPVFSVGPGETVEACMVLMTNQRVRHLPVLEHDQMIGLISIGDVLKAVIADQQVLINDLESFITGTRA